MDRLYERNRQWANRISEDHPDYFKRLSGQQSPAYMWIGCSDSRVPANQIVDLPPGEVFVHRNIANVVAASDLNLLSVLQYAVEVLKVRNVIVCGHYDCGGINAALSDQDHGLIDNWLNHIRIVQRLHPDEFGPEKDDEAKAHRLVELNVVEGVNNVCNTTVVRNAWKRGQNLEVHGVVYSLTDGVLRQLVRAAQPSQVSAEA